MAKLATIAAVAALASLFACEEHVAPIKVPPPPEPPADTAPPQVAPADPLGPRPTLAPPKAFDPPAPEIWKLANGMTVWLVERHTLPLVSVTIAVPTGSSSDPQGKAGLAFITADMLDEGAGSRSAVELSSAVNDLGASLTTDASSDGSTASLTVLKKNLRAGFELLADVVVRPRFDGKEWKRVHDLWVNDLKKRADDPQAVARVVGAAVLFGRDSEYGHPIDGFVESAKDINLATVKDFYKESWRPDQATMVVAGDVTKADLDAIASSSSLGAWKAVATQPEPAPAFNAVAPPPKLVLVDRKDAPQSVVAIVSRSVPASDPRVPLLDMLNTALGGSFTSRLNQNLREDHHYTYGASSRFNEMRSTGAFRAGAAVRTDVTGASLHEMLGELSKMAAAGLTEDELAKVKAQDRADLVEAYQQLGGITRRLASLSILGLPPDYDLVATRQRQAASLDQLKPLAAAVDPKNATIVIVGPKKEVLPQLQKEGLEPPALWTAEGEPAKQAKGK